MPNKECLSDMNKLLGMVVDEGDGMGLLNVANPRVITDEADSKTFGCSVSECTYECSFVFLTGGAMFPNAEAGVCAQALEIMSLRRSAES